MLFLVFKQTDQVFIPVETDRDVHSHLDHCIVCVLCVFSYEDHSEEKSPAASTDKDAKKDKWATAVPPHFENQTTDHGLVSFFIFFFFFFP